MTSWGKKGRAHAKFYTGNKADTDCAASALKRLRSGIARERKAGNLPGLIVNNIDDDRAAGGSGGSNGGR